MTNQALSRRRERLLLAIGAAALALLGGCAVAPVDPYMVGAPVAYPAPAYGPVYGAPAYPVYPAPYYYGPSLSLGVYRGWSGDRDHWHGRPPPPRPGWGGHEGPRPGGWNRPPAPPRPDVRPPQGRPNNTWVPRQPRLSGVEGGG